jgi:mRNA interferase MazF
MPLPEAMRGEVWDVDFTDFGEHPAVIMSVNPLNVRLGHVAVIPVSGTRGPDLTHIRLTPDAGLTRYPESYADITALQPVARTDLLRQRGRLNLAELDSIAGQLRTYLGL